MEDTRGTSPSPRPARCPSRSYTSARCSRAWSSAWTSTDQFVDLCILLGCDYCDYCDYCEEIRGTGPKNAIRLIQEHKSIEEIVKKENARGRFLKVSETFTRDYSRFQIVIPADGGDALDDYAKQCKEHD